MELVTINEESIKKASIADEVIIRISFLKGLKKNSLFKGGPPDLTHSVFEDASDFALLDEEKEEKEINKPDSYDDSCIAFCNAVLNDYKQRFSYDGKTNFTGNNSEKLVQLADRIKDKWIDYFIRFKPNNAGNRIDENDNITEEIEDMDIMEEIKKFSEGNSKQIIFHGAPGTSKTYSIREWMKDKCIEFESYTQNKQATLTMDENNEKGVWQFVQFHSSYDYTDFVEGLRPAILSENESEPTFIKMDGVFKRFCRKAYEAEKNGDNRKFFFVIDEINRADLGKVFGELMFGLEEDYRGEGNKFPTQYMNLPTYEKTDTKDANFKIMTNDVFEKGFFIPDNVYIIGTMNDIDRSVDSLDFAMRRRFKWVEVKAASVMDSVLNSMIKTNDGGKGELIENLKKRMEGVNGDGGVNGEIKKADKKLGLSEDYCIGPVYLKRFEEYNPGDEFNPSDENFIQLINEVWDTKIKQILVNYCRGRDKDATKALIESCEKEFKQFTN